MNTQPAKNLNIDIKMEKEKEEKMHIDQNNGKRVHRKKRRRRKRKEKKSTQDISQRFVVKKWSAVALWCYDVIQTECGICRNSLIELCTECQLNHDSETCSECSTVIGACNRNDLILLSIK
ncbi:e3 ubiquitin-protein ligase rbx1 [Anaeramoeba flamelloides]|uniref:E3 ubiquitin-protein ligase rbx1 n=1 Tax=Anaeramoeba flamelloides TaxID=1746091 RepID=A0AAV7ZYW3_9EUKA|nr:e3 ubiquitin-protein ligase rbx1 [Anaeramoeba flamelloides]